MNGETSDQDTDISTLVDDMSIDLLLPKEMAEGQRIHSTISNHYIPFIPIYRTKALEFPATRGFPSG